MIDVEVIGKESGNGNDREKKDFKLDEPSKLEKTRDIKNYLFSFF